MTRLDKIAARRENPRNRELIDGGCEGTGEYGGCLDASVLIEAMDADLAALLAVVRDVTKVAVPVGVTPSDDSWWKGHEEAMRRVRVQLAPLTETTEETNNAG